MALKVFILALSCILVFQTFSQDAANTDDELQKSNPELIKELDSLFKLRINVAPDEALKFAEEALELSTVDNYREGMARSYNNIGLFYKNQGVYDEALRYYLNAEEIYTDISDATGKAIVFNNIGTIYSLTGDYAKALEQYKSSYRLLDSLGIKERLIGALVNLGNVYSAKNEDYRAIEFYSQALTINDALPEDKKTYDPVINIGNIYFRRQEYDRALRNYRQALLLEEETGSVLGQANALYNIGVVQYVTDKPGQALETLLEAEKKANSVTSSPLLTLIYMKLSEIYRDRGDFKLAYNYLARHDQLEDFFHSEQMARKLAEIAVSREFEKKEAELKIVSAESELNKVRVDNIRAVVIIGFMVFFLTGAGIYISYKIKVDAKHRYFRKG